MFPDKPPIPLRPHHGMCLAYFSGHGYSAEFSAHMARQKAILEQENPDILLTVGADSICSACPNLRQGQCRTPDRVARFDRAVLDRCGLQERQVLPFRRFSALVRQQILTPGLRPQICWDCQWNTLCF